ncbi:MAG TPA: C39 family peptidase [Candidatus Acidoferrales bacterium]|nr:C39 family peptidase [Candidatus Acidoferrales bacterium]
MRRSAAKTCLAILAAACLARAASPPRRASPPGVWLDVPFVAQKKNACGAASLAMVMQYWASQRGASHAQAADDVAIEAALDPRAKGISNDAMVAYLKGNSYQAFAFSAGWNDLRENLGKGRPLIVALGPQGAKGPLHYVVAAGIDWVHDFVFVNDPAQRKMMRVARSEFEDEWKATGNWALLAVPLQK